MPITEFTFFGSFNKPKVLDKLFKEKYFSSLKNQIRQNDLIDVLFDYCFISDRLLGMYTIHSTMVLNNDQMKTLFDGTKNELKKIFYSSKDFGNYNTENTQLKKTRWKPWRL